MGAGSVKGLVLMETIFPTGDNSTVFDDPKMRQKLMAEIKKGKIKPPTATDEVDVDEDQDSKIDAQVQEIWSYYDPKGLGTIQRKQVTQFFKDCFTLHCLRKRQKEKEALGAGVTMKVALENATRMLDPSNTGVVSKQTFIDFLNEVDLVELLGPFTGQTGPRSITSRLPQNMLFDPSTLPRDAGGKVNLGEVKYRDYNQTLE